MIPDFTYNAYPNAPPTPNNGIFQTYWFKHLKMPLCITM